MFEHLDRLTQQLIFVGLKELLETGHNAGMIFHNGDPGHPIYLDGAEGVNTGPIGYIPDSAEKNRVFKMLSELSQIFKADDDTGWICWYDFTEWSDFCKFVRKEYYRRHDEKES